MDNALTDLKQGWQSMDDVLPAEKQEVLLCWTYPDWADAKPLIRMGALMWKPRFNDAPIWQFNLDYGDAGAWVYTAKNDEQPTHWMPLPAAPEVGAAA